MQSQGKQTQYLCILYSDLKVIVYVPWESWKNGKEFFIKNHMVWQNYTAEL